MADKTVRASTIKTKKQYLEAVRSGARFVFEEPYPSASRRKRKPRKVGN